MEGPVDFSSLFSKKRNNPKKIENEPANKKKKTIHRKEDPQFPRKSSNAIVLNSTPRNVQPAPSQPTKREKERELIQQKRDRKQFDDEIREKLNSLAEKETKKGGILNLNTGKKLKKKKASAKASIQLPINRNDEHDENEEDASESMSSDDDRAVIVNSSEDEGEADEVRQSLVRLMTQRSLHYHGPPEEGLEMSSTTSEEEKEAPVQKDPAALRLASSTVMIGGLNMPLTKPELRRFLSSCGRIKDVRFVLPQRDVPTKVAFVDFANKEGAYQALQLHHTRHEGRVLTVTEASQPKGSNKNASQSGSKFVMFVKHLPLNATEEELRELFGDCGKILHISLPVTNNNILKGFAFVEFETATALNLALKARVTLHGKKLIVENSDRKS